MLYTAGSINFLGLIKNFQRHGKNALKTEEKHSWLSDPDMISIHLAEISKISKTNEDDSMLLFLTENAVEERHRLRLSRVVRVCKSDLGGLRTLQKKWTSFLKAHLDCPFGGMPSQSLVEDVFLLRNEKNLLDSVFYATFTSNLETSSSCSQSAVCAYKLSDIQQVFKGNFLTMTDSGCWVKYTEEVPNPYPENMLFTAGSLDALGKKPAFQKHTDNVIKTEEGVKFLSEPTMVSIHMAEISNHSENNEDDNVFLFFIEDSLESQHQTRLSRVARVCKSDVGGSTIMRNRFVSFLKARLDCPFGDVGAAALVQDVFFLRDKNNIKNSLFYATFISNKNPSSTCSQSAVCAYRLSDIRHVFTGGLVSRSPSGSWTTVTEPFPPLYLHTVSTKTRTI
ncbi:hypothetical protein CCH79_00015186 [Gambusia affinis]|uniref:Sema domain-containing protein n=1 Tax=Gambusia affinis TaxID=33528 RepID=A0A315VI32_GAMAF|nr:hypothetical protein CCH79_00015186 [Gambusia affinis]